MASKADDRKGPGQGRREPAAHNGDGGDDDTQVLRLLEEQLSISKERLETGRVRVRVITREHEEAVDVPLSREHVEVDRIPIGREIEAIPPRRQEGDVTILPVVEEVVVMRRKLVLKEELHVRLVRTTEQHRENVSLRRQEAVIERLPVKQLSTEQKSD